MDEGERNLSKSLAENAEKFFTGIGASPHLKEHLAGADQIAQFAPKDGKPFFVCVKAGALEFGKREKYSRNDPQALYVIEVEDCLQAIFSGQISLGEAVFEQKIQIPGYRNKEPAIARFSKMLRMGVWDQLSGSPLLMPLK
jgi:hypothetical protein